MPERMFIDHSTGVREVFAAEEYRREFPNAVIAICGDCHRRWDDSIASSWTPTSTQGHVMWQPPMPQSLW